MRTLVLSALLLIACASCNTTFQDSNGNVWKVRNRCVLGEDIVMMGSSTYYSCDSTVKDTIRVY